MEERYDFGVLEITNITRKMECKEYEMQWTVSKYSQVVSDKLHTMHNIVIGKEACGFKLYKSIRDDSDVTKFVVALSPTPESTTVTFQMLQGGEKLDYQAPGVDLHVLEGEVQASFRETPQLKASDEFTILTSVTISSIDRGLSIFQPLDNPASSWQPLGNLLETGKFSDVQVRVGNKVFNAHRAILCTRCPVFASKLESDREWCVRIDDFDSDSVHEMLNYIYTGETRKLDLDLAVSLLELADKYRLPMLMDKAAAFLAKDLSMDHAMATMELADVHNHLDLRDATTHFIAKNLLSAMQHRGWTQFQEKKHLFNRVLKCVAELNY